MNCTGDLLFRDSFEGCGNLKRICILLAVCILLSGCAGGQNELNRVLQLRARLQENGCSFVAVITADYADYIYTFSMSCTADSNGNVCFEVIEPETISGIRGEISSDGGKLLFEDVALSFSMLADGQITPVSAPWLLVKTLFSGFLSAAATEGELLHVMANDSYYDDALLLDIWFSSGDHPVKADILYRDRRIMSIKVENFRVL